MNTPGEQDVQVTVERPVSTPDPEFGSPVITWTAVFERQWAKIQDALPSRSESVTQGLAVARNQSRLRMRYREDITSDMRVTVHRDADTVYQIVGGPAMIGGRKERIEVVLERYSS